MARTLLLLVTGAIVGGASVYVVAGGDPGPAAAVPGADSAPTARDIGSPRAGDLETREPAAPGATSATGGVVSARVAAYERALGATDAVDLESMIGLAIAAPRSRARDLDIAALVARLAELDPRRAVDFAQAAFLDTPFLVQAFEALARADAEASVAALARVAPAAKQRRVALALLEVLGHERGIALVGAALPDDARASFELDALVARAATDPAGAIEQALGQNSMVLQGYLLPRLAEAAVRIDPASALALGDSIAEYALRLSYQVAVLNAWAELDPEGAFAMLETAEPRLLSMSSQAFGVLARYDSDRLLAMVDELLPVARTSARRAVMQSLAERDPEAALAMLDTMPPGQDREQMLATIAQTYGRQNPELAMAWVRSLAPPSQSALQSVLQGIAAVDTNRAIDLFLEEIDSRGPAQPGVPALQSSLSFSMMMALMSSNGADVGRLADRLLERDDPQVRSMLSSSISLWASLDSDAALSWTLANAERLDPMALRSVAQRMASENLDLALGTLDQLPASHRVGWIEGVVSQMAQTDIARAQGFLGQLRGQPGYEQAYGAVTQAMARTDPAAAARMLSGAPSSSSMALQSAAFTIAREWASRDPAEAARWALTLEDAQLQQSTVSNVASMWTQRDAAAAERWLFGLGAGAGRDAAADGYIGAAAQAGRFEPRLLDAYSSEQARQQGASRAIVAIGRSDPAEARQLLDRYVTDPAVRAETEAQLARSSGSGSGVFIADGQVIFLQ
jgi:hypothetical protein